MKALNAQHVEMKKKARNMYWSVKNSLNGTKKLWKNLFEKIFEGNVGQQIYIAKIFKENMHIKEKMMKNEK